ncbi:nucleoside 2-deoxyribosyltransferase [Variovorax sp. PAMC26660]|uniref:nucleoside 2-deoxyribosyltransferase n=1 Tax=Variovorax sp. PAMC26660 TaxID=2762322 RepID=UPI00164E1248|nr:nucleoside 2-deoxyribosyltransferase [Variovorax sp. PAMC26660]QNK66103.1 nucleoside 2-deoxyribosyltransferase [Variovorax sp. PAMC26660]
MPLPLSWPRVYVAGPDVFRVDAAAHLQELVRICEAHELRAVLPSDDQAPVGQQMTPEELARHIYRENMKRLRSARGVIANLAPFRGIEPDSGTVFEVGVAVALGLPVVAYGVPPRSYASRVQSVRDTQGVLRDASGAAIEDFGLSMNLMLSCSTHTAPTATEAIKVMATLLR